LKLSFDESLKTRGLECARGIADWICMVQTPGRDRDPASGRFAWMVMEDGEETAAQNWNMAFAIMGLLSASKAFDEPAYEDAALAMARYLKTLQIFEPEMGDRYGAIREKTPQTPWCYTRDALSAAWAFVELYRHTGEEFWLERAKLWGQWFLAHGMDEEGWPLWGHQFGPFFKDREPQMRNDMQGCFQGGSLNFLYHIGKETGDPVWTGEVFTRMADHFVRYIQQPSGYFISVERATKKPPEEDPQGGLHRSNDDLGTLGLLCAHAVTGNGEYLESVRKFLTGVFASQGEDGRFEKSVAGIPVVLNTIHEAPEMEPVEGVTDQNAARALEALYRTISDGAKNPRMKGALVETGDTFVCARSSCYALIVLLKLFAGQADYLRVQRVSLRT